MFNLDEGKNGFKKPSREESREFSQKEHNVRRKQISKILGENFATLGLLAIIAVMICSIWTEVGIFTNWTKIFGEALMAIILYILADVLSASIGAKGGKVDENYINNHRQYLDLRQQVRKAGAGLLNMFCDWQIDVEYEYYLRYKCKELKIDYNEYMEKYHDKTLEELQVMFPIEKPAKKKFMDKIFEIFGKAKTSTKAAKVFSLNQIKPIELTPEILMTDGKVRGVRGGVSISGEEYIEKHTIGAGHIVVTIMFAIVAVIPVISLVREFSVAMLIYTIFKIALLLFRMYRGWSRGAKGYSEVEPKSLQSKIDYLEMYLNFLNNKTYESLKDKYVFNSMGEYAENKREEQTYQNGA